MSQKFSWKKTQTTKHPNLFRIVNHGAYTFSNISSGTKNLIKALAKISNSSKDHVLNTNGFHEKEAFFSCLHVCKISLRLQNQI